MTVNGRQHGIRVATNSIGTFVDRYIVARRKRPGSGEPGYAGADHGDFEAGFRSHVG